MGPGESCRLGRKMGFFDSLKDMHWSICKCVRESVCVCACKIDDTETVSLIEGYKRSWNGYLTFNFLVSPIGSTH